MIEKNDIIAIAEEFLTDSQDYLVDVIITPGNLITVEIDNDQGVDLEECIQLSQHIESKLNRDIEDYELTVTSAGLTSPLKTRRQYKKYEGKDIEVLTKKGEKTTGILKTSNETGFTIEISKKVKPEGAKRKIEIKEEKAYSYDEIKHTKYLIRF